MRKPLVALTALVALATLATLTIATTGLAEKEPKSLLLLYTTAKYTGNTDNCDYNAIHNLIQLADADLWPLVPTPSAPSGFARAPCGGSPQCDDPLLAPRVKCHLEITDCNFGKPGEPYQEPKVLKTLFLECRGDMACAFEHKRPQNCCAVTKQVEGKVGK
jgi:hypothetical protein